MTSALRPIPSSAAPIATCTTLLVATIVMARPLTWILGSGVMFGYGALISDVRVSWGSGETLDALQKIYPVARSMMAGFAGSVELGFQLIADMQRAFVLPPGRMWPPKVAAWPLATSRTTALR